MLVADPLPSLRRKSELKRRPAPPPYVVDAYVVYSTFLPEIAYKEVLLGSIGIPLLAEPTAMRATGPRTVTVSPPLPAGLALDPVTGTISGTPAGAGITSHEVTLRSLRRLRPGRYVLRIAGPRPGRTDHGDDGTGSDRRRRVLSLSEIADRRPGRRQEGARRRNTATMSPTGPRWRSLSGLTTELTPTMPSSATSRTIALRTEPALSRTSAPGWPLTSTR